MERSEIPHDPRHLGVPSGASKTIFEPMVRLTQTVHLSYIKISTIPKQAELSLETRHLGLPSGASKTISKPMARLAQTIHVSCTDTNTVSKRKEARFQMTHVTLEFHQVCPKRFPSLWYVRRKPCSSYLASRLALSPNGPKWAST